MQNWKESVRGKTQREWIADFIVVGLLWVVAFSHGLGTVLLDGATAQPLGLVLLDSF